MPVGAPSRAACSTDCSLQYDYLLYRGIFMSQPRTNNAPTGRVDRNWTTSGGKAPWPGFLLVGELAQVPHYPETRTSPGGYLHRACCCNGSVG